MTGLTRDYNSRVRRAVAPGRVNLIGEYTDIVGGHVLPIAIQLATTVTFEATEGDRIELRSAADVEPAVVPLRTDQPDRQSPGWARYVAAVVDEVRPQRGGTGEVSTTLPIGSGLSSSAALEVAVALAVGFEGTAVELALLCQRAEQRASGVPCGVMDQLASAAGIEGHALLIDCATTETTPIALPEGIAIVVVDSGQRRSLADSTAYAERRASCERAAAEVGPLRDADLADLDAIDDPIDRRRARHVVTEEARVRAVVAAFEQGDAALAGAVLVDGHRSLRDDFEVSTPVLDRLVDDLVSRPGVHGARLTGAGFGGSVVALCDPGAIPPGGVLIRASAAATVETAAR